MAEIKLEAKPAPVSFDPAKTAVIVVDMQNDFGSKGGLFDRMGIDLSIVRNTIEPTSKVLAAARRAGIKVIYLKMAFRPDLSDMGAEGSVNRVGHLRSGAGQTVTAPDGRESRVLIRDTWNTEVIPELAPQPDDLQLYKHRFSGFYQTELDAILKKGDVKHLILTGCTTSICVESTMRDAMFRDYIPVLLEDCTAEPIGHDLPRSNHDATLTLVPMFGFLSSSAELTKVLPA